MPIKLRIFVTVERSGKLEKRWPREVRYVGGKYINRVPTKRTSTPVDRQRGALLVHCWPHCCRFLRPYLAISFVEGPEEEERKRKAVGGEEGRRTSNLGLIVRDRVAGHPHCDGNAPDVNKKEGTEGQRRESRNVSVQEKRCTPFVPLKNVLS